MTHSGDSPASSDVLIIGLGVTGTIALQAARAAGVNAIGIERLPAPPDGGIDGCHYETRAWGAFPSGSVVCASRHASSRCDSKAIIIATGSIDLPLPLPGWELTGVTGAYHAARTLDDGVDVAVIRGPSAGLGNRTPSLDRFNVVLDYDLAAGDAVVISGTDAVESVTIADTTTPIRLVLLDNGLQPENVLARMTGLPTLFSAPAGGDVIVPGSVVAAQGTLLSIVGDAAGIGGEFAVICNAARDTGRLLAESVAGGPIPVSIPSRRPDWTEGGTPNLPSQTTDATLLCPDEGITVGMAREAIRRGATTVNDVKRRTRAAMAVCQGRDCLWTIRALLAEQQRAYMTPMTARPPAAGITVGELASLTPD